MFSRRNSRAIGLAVFLTLPAALVRGETDWIGNDGNWSDPANWSTLAVPADGDSVFIANGDATSRTINYDYTGPLVALASLNINNSGGGTDSLSLANSGATLSLVNEYIGGLSSGAGVGAGSVVQSGGANLATGGIVMAQGADSVGEYNLSCGKLNSGGNLTLSFDGFARDGVAEVIGLAGSAEFNQSGGTNATGDGGFIVIGTTIGSTGTYTLSGTGTLNWV